MPVTTPTFRRYLEGRYAKLKAYKINSLYAAIKGKRLPDAPDLVVSGIYGKHDCKLGLYTDVWLECEQIQGDHDKVDTYDNPRLEIGEIEFTGQRETGN